MVFRTSLVVSRAPFCRAAKFLSSHTSLSTSWSGSRQPLETTVGSSQRTPGDRVRVQTEFACWVGLVGQVGGRAVAAARVGHALPIGHCTQTTGHMARAPMCPRHHARWQCAPTTEHMARASRQHRDDAPVPCAPTPGHVTHAPWVRCHRARWLSTPTSGLVTTVPGGRRHRARWLGTPTSRLVAPAPGIRRHRAR
jgi:hypothetical protein